jgi:superkiller protein 3
MKTKTFIILFIPLLLHAQSSGDDEKAKQILEKAKAANERFSYQESLKYYLEADSLSSAVFTTEDYNNMGGAYFQLGMYEKALEASQKAVLLDSINFKALFNMGITYTILDSLSKAIECYQKVVKINLNHTSAYFNMATLYHKLKNDDIAMELYQRIIEIDSTYVKAYINMGVTYGEMGNYKKLIECYQKAARLGNKEARDYLSKTGQTW